MSGAEKFIRWYANRIATTDMVDARNKLFSIRAKNPKMYDFLVSEFKGDSSKSQYQQKEEDDEYSFVKDRVRYKKLDEPSQSSMMVSRMIVDSSIPRRTNIPIATTNMAASSNIPMYTQMSTSSNIPETKMLSKTDYEPIISRRYPLPDNTDDELRYLEELAQVRRLKKQGTNTKMSSRQSIPDETQTFMAKDSNIPPSLNQNQMRFLRGEDYEK